MSVSTLVITHTHTVIDKMHGQSDVLHCRLSFTGVVSCGHIILYFKSFLYRCVHMFLYLLNMVVSFLSSPKQMNFHSPSLCLLSVNLTYIPWFYYSTADVILFLSFFQTRFLFSPIFSFILFLLLLIQSFSLLLVSET